MFLRYPFNRPGYRYTEVSEPRGRALDMLRCPVADYLTSQNAADLCVATWCNSTIRSRECGAVSSRATVPSPPAPTDATSASTRPDRAALKVKRAHESEVHHPAAPPMDIRGQGTQPPAGGARGELFERRPAPAFPACQSVARPDSRSAPRCHDQTMSGSRRLVVIGSISAALAVAAVGIAVNADPYRASNDSRSQRARQLRQRLRDDGRRLRDDGRRLRVP